jgi:hypothetical protein
MSAIPCASVSMKTMADGTLRISFDVEPNHAQDAFKLFAAPGTPAAIAALQVGYAQAGNAPIPSNPGELEKPKGGALAKLARRWGNDPEFKNWINSTTHNGIYWHCNSPNEAKLFVLEICEIDSRAELDSDEVAAETFQRLIRGPYVKYLHARGLV